MEIRIDSNPFTAWLAGPIAGLVFLCLASGPLRAHADWPRMVPSRDGTPISFEIVGSGQQTLVFVHGWSCDARYWRAQVPHFSKNHRVVTLDLGGHGHSGMTRSHYTIQSFGEDVRAVTNTLGNGDIILIGHSMGGVVIAEAARHMTNQVKGLIGVDTLQNVEYSLTREELNKMTMPLKKDFPTGSRQFVAAMISPHTNSQLRDWILADMAAAPPAVALSALNNLMIQYITGEIAKLFDDIRLPVVAVNGDLWPIDYEANRRHMISFEAIVLKDADHFLMLNHSDAFNRALEKAIQKISIESHDLES